MQNFWLKFIFQIIRSLSQTKNDLVLENLALRQQLYILKRKSGKMKLNDADRFFWVKLSKFWKQWKTALIIVQPATVVKWHKLFSRKIWALESKRKTGRKPIDREIIKLIRQMAFENIGWGTSRIHGELVKLGYCISERTVARYLPRDESHCRSLVNEFVEYYNFDRPHSFLAKDCPEGRPESKLPERSSRVLVKEKRLGGLHHIYKWAA